MRNRQLVNGSASLAAISLWCRNASARRPLVCDERRSSAAIGKLFFGFQISTIPSPPASKVSVHQAHTERMVLPSTGSSPGIASELCLALNRVVVLRLRLHRRASAWRPRPSSSRRKTHLLSSRWRSQTVLSADAHYTILGSIPLSSISRIPTEMGSLNRRGPALPGLK